VLSDDQVRWTVRILTLSALAAFVAFLATRHGLVFLASVVLAVAAYAFFREDLKRNPIDLPPSRPAGAEDRVGEGSESAVSPGVLMAGVPLSFETRSRWGRRR
jgi:hypothetical protein